MAAIAVAPRVSPRWLPGLAIAVTLAGLPMLKVHVTPEVALFPLQRVIGTKDDVLRPDVVLLRKERYRSPRRLVWARAIAAVTEPATVIVARGVGALGYETDLTVLDAYGLVSPEVVNEATPRMIAPGHDKRVQRGFFLGRVPDVLFAFVLDPTDKGQVIDVLPRQWALFEDLGPEEAVYVAEIVHPEGEGLPESLLLVRLLRDGEAPEAMRERFKDQVRAAGFRAPKLPPLDERRREVAIEKRRGGKHLAEVLWSQGHRPEDDGD